MDLATAIPARRRGQLAAQSNSTTCLHHRRRDARGLCVSNRADVWTPIVPTFGKTALTRNVSILGRLSAGSSMERANAELATHVLPVADRGPRSAMAFPAARRGRRQRRSGQSRAR
jgi:hypothetical protein